MLQSTLYRAGMERFLTSEEWPDLIESGGYSALIFDCDGTLVDSFGAHFAAFQAAVSKQGFAMDLSWYNTRTGLDRQSTLNAFAQDAGGGFDVPRAIRDSISSFLEGGAQVTAIEETVALLNRFAPSHPICVVTNSERPIAKASLGAIGVLDRVTELVTVSDDLPPKPAPDLFEHAASRMGVKAERILVFEDSGEGIRAGRAAGMDVVGLRPDH